MTPVEWLVVGLVGPPVVLAAYAYAGYPLALALLGRRRGRAEEAGDGRAPACAPDASTGGAARDGPPGAPAGWPRISILVPAHDEADVIDETLDGLLTLDYPADRRQILVVSDGSTDGTDRIVAARADQGVGLLSLDRQHGKTAAQAVAVPRLDGDIVVNVDASVSVPPDSLRRLIEAFRDPTVGVASGRDVSVGREADVATRGEARYVGYEMRVRELETRLGSIVGASGCFYAARREVFEAPLPGELNRDFGSALVARELGYRAVSVRDAVCRVPRTSSLAAEFRRKVRTMTRGLHTLAFKRHLLNPVRHGSFAWMLFSHKLCRWMVPLLVPLAVAGGVLWAATASPGLVVLPVAAAALCGLAAVGVRAATFFAAVNAAALVAWWNLLRGSAAAVWNPTPRPGAGE